MVKKMKGVGLGSYKNKKTIYVDLYNGMYSLTFDYKTLDLMKATDVHTGEWIDFTSKSDIEYFKKRYNKIYTYGRRRAREFKG